MERKSITDGRLELWHALECPFSMRARLLLAEKGLRHVSHVVTLEDVGDEVRRKNPKESVPVLQDGDCVLYETMVIAEYLEQSAPEPRLFPQAPELRARARLLVDWCDARLVPAVRALEAARRRGHEPREPIDGALQEHLARAYKSLRTVGRVLGERPFILGDFGVVDLMFAPFVVDVHALGLRRDEIPKSTVAWIDCLRDRPIIAAEARKREHAVRELAPTGT